MVRTAPLALIVLAACGAADGYVPFDAATVDAARAERGVQGEIGDVAETATVDNAAATFQQIVTLYEAGLADTVPAVDAHLEVEGWGFVDAGVTLDREWRHAASVGAAAADAHDVSRAAELVDKLLHPRFQIQIYDGLASRTRAGLDAAFGYVGLDEDGTPSAGLARVALGRETEYGVTIVPGLFGAFLDARAALEAGTAGDEALGDDAAYDEAVTAIDRALLRTLGLYATHELAEVPTEPDVADVKLAEARAVWEGVAGYAAHADATAAGEVIDALYPAGSPVRGTAGYVFESLDDVADGTVVIDAAGATAAIQGLLPE